MKLFYISLSISGIISKIPSYIFPGITYFNPDLQETGKKNVTVYTLVKFYAHFLIHVFICLSSNYTLFI